MLRAAVVTALLMLCLADCPDGWKSFKDFCFRLTDSQSNTFSLAESSCRKLHPSAHLASLHSEDENKVAADTAINGTAWIGLKRVKERWRWSDRTFVDFTNWEQEAGTNGSCAQLANGQQWRNDVPCGDEENAGASEPTHKKGAKEKKKPNKRDKRKTRGKRCPTCGKRKSGLGLPALCKVPHMETCGGPDWIRAGDFCYNFSSPNVLKSWNEAGSGCLQMDARFVAVFNARQNDVLRRLAHLTGSNVWLGLIHTDDGFHRWADGAIMTFENFGPHDHYDADHKCVFMDDLTGQWQHEQCSTPMEYVCMRPKLRLYDMRTANESRPRATVEIWRRIEEALVPARAPPSRLQVPPPTSSTRAPALGPGIRTSLEEEVDEDGEKISAGISTNTGGGQQADVSTGTGGGQHTDVSAGDGDGQ